MHFRRPNRDRSCSQLEFKSVGNDDPGTKETAAAIDIDGDETHVKGANGNNMLSITSASRTGRAPLLVAYL